MSNSHTHHVTLFDDESKWVDRFGLLLVVTVGAIVVQSLIDMRKPDGSIDSSWGALALTLFVGATFALAARASGVARRWRRVADVIVVASILAVTALLVVDVTTDIDLSSVTRRGPPLARGILAALTPVAVGRRLTRHLVVNRSTLIGAISAYLLIALAFNYIFLSIDSFQSEPFFGQAEASTRFMYFSLVTLTTLGYGDLAPATNLGGLAATFEAVIAQIFLVTFVAMLVGLWIAEHRSVAIPMPGSRPQDQAND
ncbi:MAG: potassium channel family protein [Acidimicrobiales bacterium]